MTKTMWRVAAGRGGRFIGAYLSQSIVTLGWRALGDEAERSSTLTHLMDLDELAQYDGFDEAGRALLPLRRLYWPADSVR